MVPFKFNSYTFSQYDYHVFCIYYVATHFEQTWIYNFGLLFPTLHTKLTRCTAGPSSVLIMNLAGN